MKPLKGRWDKFDPVADEIAGEAQSDKFNCVERRGCTPANQNYRSQDRSPHHRPP
jgi:hypothetical protein